MYGTEFSILVQPSSIYVILRMRDSLVPCLESSGQKDYLSGKANVSDTEGMMDSMEYIQKWKNLGMLDCSNSDPADDGKTEMIL